MSSFLNCAMLTILWGMVSITFYFSHCVVNQLISQSKYHGVVIWVGCNVIN